MKEPLLKTASEVRGKYESIRGKQKAFTREIETVLRRVILSKKLDVVNIEARTKSIDGFCDKALREDKNYLDPIREITDLTGCRVICYYTSDISKISKVIEDNFEVDVENSVDRMEAANPNQFGYQSKHLVVSFSSDRLKLEDFREFRGMKAEIQIRTSLQHSWAAIEHKLQYKNAEHIAPPLKRKLFRIAALLELADEEFNYLEKNIGSVRKEITKSIGEGDLSQGINVDSVDIYIISSGIIHEVLDYFRRCNFSIAPSPPSARKPIAKLIDTLIVAEIGSVADLEKSLFRISPRSKWQEIVQTLHDRWREIVPHPKPVVDQFTIVRIMVCLTSNDKIFRRILREVPFGPTIQKALSETREKIN